MAITSLSGIGGTTASTDIANAGNKFQTAIDSLASGTNQQDVANLSIATQLQAGTAALNVAAGNITQALSLTQIASGGIGQIGQIVGQLQSLASEAQSPVLNASNRSKLNQQFVQLTNTLNTIASTTSFNGENLLDGSLAGNNALSLNSLLSQGSGNDTTLSIPDSTSQGLLGGSLDISTPEDAAQALTTLGNALNQVTGTQTGIAAFQQGLNSASAYVDSALTNYQAAQSNLSDTDFAAASTQDASAQVQYDAAIAVQAQANNLTPALLQLVA